MKYSQIQSSSQSSSSSTKSRCFCKCKKSQCLKLYCECFARLGYCGQGCHCLDCLNSSQHETVRNQAIEDLKSRTFVESFPEKLQHQKVISNSNISEQSTSKKITDYKGCNCRRTRCLKKYCDCFNAGSLCGNHCKCSGCENTGNDEKLENEKQMKKTFDIYTTQLSNKDNPMLKLLLSQSGQLNTNSGSGFAVQQEKQQEQLIYPQKSQNSNNLLVRDQSEIFKQEEKQFSDQALDFQQSNGINSPCLGSSQSNSNFTKRIIGDKDVLSQQIQQHSQITEQIANHDDEESMVQGQFHNQQQQQQQYQLQLSVMEKKLKQIQLLEAVFIHQEALKQSNQKQLNSSRDSYETKIQSFKNHCQGTEEAIQEINRDIQVDLKKQEQQQYPKQIISHQKNYKDENNAIEEDGFLF